jgi:hypothetical protein
MDKEQTKVAAHKLLNKILVPKFPEIIKEIDVVEIKEFPQDTLVRLHIYITEKAFKDAYDRYLSTRDYDDDELFDNINSYGDSAAELETDIGDMMGVNVYDELQSILSYVITKTPSPDYWFVAPWISDDEQDIYEI